MSKSELGIIYDFHGVLATHSKTNLMEKIYLKRKRRPYHELKLREGAEVMLTYMANTEVPQAIATAADRETIFYWYKVFGLARWFPRSQVIYSDNISRDKTDLYLKAAHSINRTPELCVLIEDDFKQMVFAYEAGFRKIIGVSSHLDNHVFVPGLISWINDFTQIPIKKILDIQ